MHQQWGPLADVEMPPTWEKDSHLPLGTTKLGNLRGSCYSSTAPTAKLLLGFSSMVGGAAVSSPPRDTRNVTGGCTGTLD